MRRHVIVIGLSFVGLAAFALFAGWAFYQGSHIGGGWNALRPIWPFVLGGVLMTGGLAAFFMWLMFYSARHGWDDPPDAE